MEDAAPQFLWRGSKPVDGTDDIAHQLVCVEGTAVGQFSFCQRPHAFIGIELWSVSGKVLDVQTRMPTQELCQRSAVVGGGIVQQNDDGASEVPQQLPKKPAHFFLADVVEVKQVVQAQVLSLRTDRNSGDDRDFVPPSLTMTLKGSAPLGCPSPGHRGASKKPDSSAKTRWAPTAQRFFYPWPLLPFPAFNAGLVAFHGASFGYLRAPVQTMHQPTDMITMVIHPKFPPDDFGDSCRGPQLRAVTVRPQILT